jgi:hypothetical protein
MPANGSSPALPQERIETSLRTASTILKPSSPFGLSLDKRRDFSNSNHARYESMESSVETHVSGGSALSKSAINAAERFLSANLRRAQKKLAWARFGTIGFEAYVQSVVGVESFSLSLPPPSFKWNQVLES